MSNPAAQQLPNGKRPAVVHNSPMKKHKIFDNKKQEGTVSNLENLPSDCVVGILKFLSTDDMNDFAICSKRCRRERSSDVLDQAQQGVIRCSKKETSYHEIHDAICHGRWDNDISSVNRTRLVVLGVETLVKDQYYGEPMDRLREVQLTSVDTLVLSTIDREKNMCYHYSNVLIMSMAVLVPNVKELHLFMTGVKPSSIALEISKNFSGLTTLSWHQDNVQHYNRDYFDMNGDDFKLAENVTELDLDCWSLTDHRDVNPYY
jgi:hypothetical protein